MPALLSSPRGFERAPTVWIWGAEGHGHVTQEEWDDPGA